MLQIIKVSRPQLQMVGLALVGSQYNTNHTRSRRSRVYSQCVPNRNPVSLCMYVLIYIYIYIERERERDGYSFVNLIKVVNFVNFYLLKL